MREMRNSRKAEGRRSLGGPKRRWEVNIKVPLEEK
jgi:hypothetical protein